MRVEVYFNLHKHTFSIRSTKSGRVICHADRVCIESPEFIVRQSGRNRVLREGKKNVHAFVRGEAKQQGLDEPDYDITTSVVYNPYKYDNFVVDETKTPVKKADTVWLGVTEQGIPWIQAEGIKND